MNKKAIAIILELIPVIAAFISFIFIFSPVGAKQTDMLMTITTLLGFFGFVFFFLGRRIAGENKAVRILGLLDWLATISIIGLYFLAIISFGL